MSRLSQRGEEGRDVNHVSQTVQSSVYYPANALIWSEVIVDG